MSRLVAVPSGSQALPCREPTILNTLFATACRGRAVVIPALGCLPKGQKCFQVGTSFRPLCCDYENYTANNSERKTING